MTTSLDPSIDEVLLLQENQYPMSNLVFTNMKPIGAERKIGQLLNTATQPISQTTSGALMKASPMPIYDQFHYSSVNEPLMHEANNELEMSTYHPIHSPSFSLPSSITNSSTIHSPQSSAYIFDNQNYQPFVQQKYHQQFSKQLPTAKHKPSCHSTNQFFLPKSSQSYSRNQLLNIYHQARTNPPMFATPLQCTRERFQVNSIGRPILRTNNYSCLSQATSFKIRR